MNQILELVIYAILLGVGGTVVMDLWAVFQKCCLGIPSLDYALVGRWLGHFQRRRFVHDNIAKSEPICGERILGWLAHYIIGIVFAGIFLMIVGLAWVSYPTF